jgi:hypothetical protein
VTAGDVDDSMWRPFARRRQLEYAEGDCLSRKQRSRNSDKRVQEYRAIVVSSVKRREV